MNTHALGSDSTTAVGDLSRFAANLVRQQGLQDWYPVPSDHPLARANVALWPTVFPGISLRPVVSSNEAPRLTGIPSWSNAGVLFAVSHSEGDAPFAFVVMSDLGDGWFVPTWTTDPHRLLLNHSAALQAVA